MNQSPAHFHHAATSPWLPGTLAQRMGTTCHAAVFEPHRLVVFEAGTYVDVDAKGREKVKSHSNTRRGKAFDMFAAQQASDAVIVNARELAAAEGVANALRNHDQAAPLLFGEGVLHEQQIAWSRRGRKCSSRPDARLPGRHIVDLKTARTSQPERFMTAARWSHYHAQLAFYQEADAAILGLAEPCADLYIVAVETVAPYVVTVFRLTAKAIDHGRASINGWWERMEVCASAGVWPGYAQAIVPFDTGDTDDDFSFGADIDAGHDVEPARDETINWDDAA